MRFVFAFCAALVGTAFCVGLADAQDWPTYLHDPGRTSASRETTISAGNAARLGKLWAFKTGGGIAASPIVAGGVVYVGSWDGYEYALNAVTGALKWKRFLGITHGRRTCPYPNNIGVTSSATVQNGVVYVGGGDAYWYALNASTGAVRWRVFTGNNSAKGGHYNWASPVIYKRSAYIGIASLGDCPLVQGQLIRVSLRTGRVLAKFNVVPNLQVGGGIFSSPTVDAAKDRVYVATSTNTNASQRYAPAIVALNATTLRVTGSWKLPLANQIHDGDWGTTPTLIGGGLVAATNKNGILYAFKRSNVSAGPVWHRSIANGGSCPECGEGSVSSAAFGGGRLYAAGGETSIGRGTRCGRGSRSRRGCAPGSVSAFNPKTGKVIWRRAEQAPVIGAVAYVNGLVLAGAGSNLLVLSASTGKTLFSYATANVLFSAPTVAGGRIYVGSQDSRVYSFGIRASAPPANTVRVNAGGSTYTDEQGGTWSADCCYSGGSVFSNNVAIAGTADPALYQSQRYSTGEPFSYTFSNLASGSYLVTLKFAEIASLGPRRRQFNVAINGTQVLTNLDVAAQVGQNTALDERFITGATSSSQITVSFTVGAQNFPMVSAIQIVPAG